MEGGKSDDVDLIALLTAIPKAKAEVETKPVLSAHEQRMKNTQERLQKLMDQSSDTLNMPELQYLIDKMKQKQDQKAEKTVEIGGKTFTKFYRDDLEPEVNRKDKEILRQKLQDHKYEEDEEDEEYRRFKLEQQFEREVGMTGRFNRGFTGVTIYDMYNDEYDDALDEHDFDLTEGLTADERSSSGVKAYLNPLGPLGMPKTSVFPTKGQPSKKSQSYSQQPIDLPKKASKLNAAEGKQTKTQQPETGKQTQQKAAPNKQPQKGQSNQQSTDDPTTQKRKDGYTGGKGRMMKERHKGQFKQRGADKKMQRANPF